MYLCIIFGEINCHWYTFLPDYFPLHDIIPPMLHRNLASYIVTVIIIIIIMIIVRNPFEAVVLRYSETPLVIKRCL
jgi:hypothetical protein